MTLFLIFIYFIPFVGTLVSMKRRVSSLWSWSISLRNLLPDDRFYKKVRLWETQFHQWKQRHSLSNYVHSERLNLTAGKFEYAIGHLRDYTIGLYMMAHFAFTLTLMVFGESTTESRLFPSLFYYGLFSFLSLWTYRRHVTSGIQMTEFMRVNTHVHPEEFFEHYYRRLGPTATPIPTKASRIVNPENISYLTGKKPQQSLWQFVHLLYDTAVFARSAYKALDAVGKEYGREVFDAMASLWGSRILQFYRARLIVEGTEKFRQLNGKVILVFNHKSHLDFALNFFALSHARVGSGRIVRPRHMAAKDHFVDNKIVYNGLGIGRLIENVDMVFVDRKGKGKLAIVDACQKLATKEIEIAMYPQGTRALGNFGPSGERLDAGFYTTGSPNSLKNELGHLKKGCAFLALDTAMALRDKGFHTPIHLVFIGIDGTGTLVPKSGYLIQTEGTVKFTVGDVFTLHPEDVEGLVKPEGESFLSESQNKYLEAVEKIQKEIQKGLVKALDLHEKLRTRFLEEIKKNSELRQHVLTLNHFLAQANREANLLPFQIIDRIYALRPSQQASYFYRLAEKIISQTELTSLRDEITDRLFRLRGQELKKISDQEKSLRTG